MVEQRQQFKELESAIHEWLNELTTLFKNRQD